MNKETEKKRYTEKETEVQLYSRLILLHLVLFVLFGITATLAAVGIAISLLAAIWPSTIIIQKPGYYVLCAVLALPLGYWWKRTYRCLLKAKERLESQ